MNNSMDQIIEIIKTNIPVLIMSFNNNKQSNIWEIIFPILIIPFSLIIFKKIIDFLNIISEKLFSSFNNYKFEEKGVTIRYYKSYYGKLLSDSDVKNIFYDHIMEYLTEEYYKQLDELNTEHTKLMNIGYCARKWGEEKPIKLIPVNKKFSIKIDDYKYNISHNSRTIAKVDPDSKDGNIKTIEYDNYYFEVKTIDHESIKQFETKINMYFANQKPLLENFHLYNHHNYIFQLSSGGQRTRAAIETKITTKKKWSNVFLTKKEEVLIRDEIMNFIKNEDKYEYDGIPWKKGYLLYGEPGCGKTSLIYCIGWMTKRDIYSIDLSSIKTNAEFNSIVKGIPSNSIILFDDIDAHEISHCRKILAEKKEKMNEEISYKNLIKSYFEKEHPTCESPHKTGKEDKDSKPSNPCTDDIKKDEFTLDTLLSYLDGYSSLHGCIVIMTTNHIEVLDQALIRPGRIDHQIEFKKCDFYQFYNIYKFFTDNDLPSDYKFKENEYTTSYIINAVVIPNRSNPEKILEILA